MRWFEQPQHHCPACANGVKPATCLHPAGAQRVVNLGGDYVTVGCPALGISDFSRMAWEVFRASHHRSPDQPGQRWQRSLTYSEYIEMPHSFADAFTAIDLETFRLAQDLAPNEDKGE